MDGEAYVSVCVCEHEEAVHGDDGCCQESCDCREFRLDGFTGPCWCGEPQAFFAIDALPRGVRWDGM